MIESRRRAASEWGRSAGRRARVAALLTTLVLFACGPGPTTGPGEIKWDRETCEHCQMVISERRHAAQVRTPGEPRTHAFDDLGCALLWLDTHGLSDTQPAQEIWVQDVQASEWIDARGARYFDGFHTPMQYGFGVAAEGMPFDAVWERVRAIERERKGKPPPQESSAPEVDRG